MAKDRTNLPSVVPPAGKLIQNARDASAISDPITGFLHGVGERARQRAIQESTRTAQALAANADAHGAVFTALVNLRDKLDNYQARDELAADHYKLARDRAHSRIQQERARLSKETAEAEREKVNAKHGLQATRRNRDANFELGDARKRARLAEVIDILPDTTPAASQPPAGDDVALLKAGLAAGERLRAQKASDGHDTIELQRALEEARAILRSAGVDL